MTDEQHHPEEPQEEQEKRVGWPELFFDLVFVFAVTGVSGLLEVDHSWGGVLRAAIVFVPFYWLWVGTAIQTNLQDVDRAPTRIAVFTIALCAIFMAIALPEVYGGLGLLFAGAYWVGRLVLGRDVLRGVRHGRWPGLTPVTVSMVLTGPLLVVGALTDDVVREVIWAAAAVIDLSTPTVLRSRLRRLHVNAAHLSERFGLFVLIALGESVVAIGASTRGDHGLTVWVGVAVAAAFLLVCGLWWVYFQFAAQAVRYAMGSASVQLDITRLVLSYGHFLFIFAIILLAVGLHETVAEPTHHLEIAVAAMLLGGTALYLATFGFTRWAMFHLVSVTRLTTAGVMVALIPLALVVPGLVVLALAAVAVTGLNVVEWRMNSRIGWRAKTTDVDHT